MFNFKVLGPKLNEKLKGHREKILADVEKTLLAEQKAAKYAPLAKAFMIQLLASAEEFLNDATAVSFSVNLGKDGIGTSLMADFAPETYLGKHVAAMKGSDASVLTGLPDAKYLVYGGGASASDSAREMIGDFLRPIEAELAKGGDDLKPVAALFGSFKKMIGAVKGQTFGMVVPNGALGASALFQSISVITGDAKVVMDEQRGAMDAQQKLMAMIPNQPEMKITFTPNAKTVDGVNFTQFTNEITGNDAASNQARQMFAIFYGPAGATGYSGLIDDQHLLTESGLDDATLSSAIKAVKDKSDPSSKLPGVALVNQHLPPSRIGAFYVAIDQIVLTGTNYAKMMGMPIPVNIKPDLPPLGFALAADGPAIHMDTFVPADLVEQLIATSLQLKVMGQGGRGKPGGL